MITYTCRECGDLFYSDDKRKRVFCDKECASARMSRAWAAHQSVYHEDRIYEKNKES